MGQTALHLAIHQGHARIVERLVGFGVNLNLQDSDGDTALHITLSRDTTKPLSAETPQLKKVVIPLNNIHMAWLSRYCGGSLVHTCTLVAQWYCNSQGSVCTSKCIQLLCIVGLPEQAL